MMALSASEFKRTISFDIDTPETSTGREGYKNIKIFSKDSQTNTIIH